MTAVKPTVAPIERNRRASVGRQELPKSVQKSEIIVYLGPDVITVLLPCLAGGDTNFFGHRLEPGNRSHRARARFNSQHFPETFAELRHVTGLDRSNETLYGLSLLLPMGTFAETSGTFVNCEGRWQSFTGIANPVDEARPGWKVLRVLGNLLDADGFDYESSEEVCDELRSALGTIAMDSAYDGKRKLPVPEASGVVECDLDVPMYQVDGVVRRASSLQLTPEARRATGSGA